jgi:hypothetical protein
MRRLNRYQKNLCIVEDRVYSYETHVATIEGDTLRILGWWSQTTSKHVNYVAAELKLKKVTYSVDSH